MGVPVSDLAIGTLSPGDSFVILDNGSTKRVTVDSLVAYISGLIGDVTGFTVANPDGGYQLVKVDTSLGQVLFTIRMRSGSDDPFVVLDAAGGELFRVDTDGTVTSDEGWSGDLPVSGSLVLGGTEVSTIPTTTNAGDPEAQITAGPGSLVLSENGLAYRKTAGSGNTGWEALAISRLPISTKAGTSYTIAAADEFTMNEFSSGSAVALTVPTNASVPIPVGAVFAFRQVGAGQVTISGAGTTLNNFAGLKTAGQWATFTLEKRATDTWLAEGLLTT